MQNPALFCQHKYMAKKVKHGICRINYTAHAKYQPPNDIFTHISLAIACKLPTCDKRWISLEDRVSPTAICKTKVYLVLRCSTKLTQQQVHHLLSPQFDSCSAMGNWMRLGKPKSCWIFSPDPLPKGKQRMPSASKYDIFSATATQGTY